MTLVCWFALKRFVNRVNAVVEPNVRVQRSNGADVRNVGSRIDPSRQVRPVQSSADGIVVESPRAGEIQQQVHQQENVHNGWMSQFRVITPQ